MLSLWAGVDHEPQDMNSVSSPRISIAEFDSIVRAELPIAVQFGLRVETFEFGRVIARAPYQSAFMRPGGTIAGPVLMGLADYTMYATTLSMIGRVELAVTTNLNINFLRKPPPRDVIAEGRMLKLGRRLAVSEVFLRSDGEDDLVAHVTGTYSIPPERSQ
jgi:uncharacterized protein (TIGR00369 family)